MKERKVGATAHTHLHYTFEMRLKDKILSQNFSVSALLEMQNAKCTKIPPHYTLQIFFCAYCKYFSITGHSKNAPSALLCKKLSPFVKIKNREIMEGKNRGRN